MRHTKCSLAFTVILISLVGCSAPKSNTELEIEIDRVRQQLDIAKSEMALYGDGAIRAMTQMQVKVLENTIAMLEQKRASWLYMINLNFDINAGSSCDSSPETLAALENDIENATSERDAAQAKADMYSGGLILAMTLAEVATHNVTLASLNQRKLMAIWGIPLYQNSSSESEGYTPAPEPAATGPVVSDDEAI